MAYTWSSALALCLAVAPTASAQSDSLYPTVVDTALNVTYEGLYRNDIEVFLGIPYGEDTSGANRFRPPQPHTPAPGSTVAAQAYGPACPQWYGPSSWYPPFSLDNITAVSEDCLTLNVARPGGVGAAPASGDDGTLLPVIVYIYGGSLITGQASDSTILPDGLILEAAENGTPVLHVAMNYRLGFFGFAQSAELKAEGSENAGLRDQRLAMEWVRDNIKAFGGDPGRITVYGQSSGASSIGIHLLSYGGAEPLPFQQAILESGIFDIGTTANYSLDLTQNITSALNCTSAQASDTLACLRALDTETLTDVSLAVYTENSGLNSGTLWTAAVDGDYLPGAPSDLVAAGALARNVTVAMGWMHDDLTAFTDPSLATADDARAALAAWVPRFTPDTVEDILSLYPASDFAADPDAGLAAEFYAVAQIYRDAVMACQPFWLGAALAERGGGGGDVFLFEWNQTILDPIFAYLYGETGVGVFHESAFAYVLGNLSHYDLPGWPFAPSAADTALARRAPRSWAAFATSGSFSGGTDDDATFGGWEPAFAAAVGGAAGNETGIFVVGGPEEGFSTIGGAGASPAVAGQRLAERCAYLTSAAVREQLAY